MSDHDQKSGGHFFDDPHNRKRIRQLLYILCAASLAADFLIHRHVDHPLEAIPAFYCLYAFIGIVVLVVLSKALRVVAMRKEDYYDG